MIKYNIYLIAFASAISGLLFGYDAGIIASAILFIKKEFILNDQQIGFIVSAVPLGALFASLLSGRLSDAIGRRQSLLFAAFLFIFGSLICMISLTPLTLILGRILLGLAIGFGSCISPVYTSELAEEKKRGWLVNIFVVMIQFGVFLSFLTGYLLSTQGAWRIMVGLGVIPALCLAYAAWILPESPRWLVVQGKRQKALDIFSNLYKKEQAESYINELESVLAHEKNISSQLFKPCFFKVIFIGAAISFFTQTVGINVLNYYAPTIFQRTGFSTPHMATLMTMLMGLVLTLSTIGSLFFIDKVGRRTPLLISTTGILMSLLLITCSFQFLTDPHLVGWMMFIGTVLFMIFHGVGIGPACFLIPSEIFPARVRGMGMGVSVACNWGANVAVAYCVPLFLTRLGPAQLFFIFFLISVIGWIVFYLYIPETKQVSLETIEKNILNNVKMRNLGNQFAG